MKYRIVHVQNSELDCFKVESRETWFDHWTPVVKYHFPNDVYSDDPYKMEEIRFFGTKGEAIKLIQERKEEYIKDKQKKESHKETIVHEE